MRGRPKTTSLERLRSQAERDELLRCIDEIALVLKTRAILDQRIHTKRDEGYTDDRAESDLAQFEARLFKLLPQLSRLAKDMASVWTGFELLRYLLENDPESVPETCDSLFMPANILLVAFASDMLAKYLHGGAKREDWLDWVVNYLVRYRPSTGYRERLSTEIKATEYLASAPVRRADVVVGRLLGVTPDHVRALRRDNRRRIARLFDGLDEAEPSDEKWLSG
jgi:hypothetical protein